MGQVVHPLAFVTLSSLIMQHLAKAMSSRHLELTLICVTIGQSEESLAIALTKFKISFVALTVSTSVLAVTMGIFVRESTFELATIS